MSSYLRKFATHNDYINFINSNALNSFHIISRCDDEPLNNIHYITNRGKLIEYIEDSYASGNDKRAGIAMGLIPNDDNWKFDLTVMVKSWAITNYCYLFCTYDGEGANSYRIIRSGSSTNGTILVNANTKSGGGGTTVNTAIAANIKYRIILQFNKISIFNLTNNTTVYNNYALGSTRGTSILTPIGFSSGRRGGHDTNGVPAKWYAFDSYHNNELVQALRPFKRYSDNRCGMIDLVTLKEFYSSSLQHNEWVGSE